jgi:molybdate transport system substrate-binding protein
VFAENVQMAMEYARTGNADASIVALSLAVAGDGGAYLPIDPLLHAPLDQQLVVCGDGPDADAARQFADFIGSREGREVMTRYGFAATFCWPLNRPKTLSTLRNATG